MISFPVAVPAEGVRARHSRPLRAATWLSLLAAAQLAAAQAGACPAPPGPNARLPEATAIPHPWPDWSGYVDALSARLRTMDLSRVELVFVGDSIVFNWSPELFQHFYGHRMPLNLGIPGDTTATLLWRLRNGNWPPALKPRLVVLSLGTNNTAAGSRPEATAQAMMQVMAELRQRAPQARLLLLGLLPRGADARDPARAANAHINSLLADCADNRQLFWADPGQMLTDAAGNLPELIAFDRLHLTMLGYSILSAALEEPLRRALQP